MRLLPVRRPSVGISIDPHKVEVVEIPPRWREGWRLRRSLLRIRQWREYTMPDAAEGAIPPWQVSHSPLTEALRELRGKLRGPVSTAISICDLCGHLAVLTFDKVPAKHAEFETLLRWRLEHELSFPTAEARMVYRLFRPREDQCGRAGTQVLIALIGLRILEECEEACLQAGLFPVAVGPESLHLFEFCRAKIQQAIEQHEREIGAPVDECFFVHRAAWGFAFFALRFGCPAFVRIKPWMTTEASASERPFSSSSSADDTPFNHELLATLQFYTETVAWASSTPLRPLFLVSTVDDRKEAETSAQTEVHHERLRSWGVAVHPLAREALLLETLPLTALPALAAIEAG